MTLLFVHSSFRFAHRFRLSLVYVHTCVLSPCPSLHFLSPFDRSIISFSTFLSLSLSLFSPRFSHSDLLVFILHLLQQINVPRKFPQVRVYVQRDGQDKKSSNRQPPEPNGGERGIFVENSVVWGGEKGGRASAAGERGCEEAESGFSFLFRLK